MLAFVTEDNYQAVGEVNAAVAAPIGEYQLEVESGGVEGESGSSDEKSDGGSDMEERVVLCLLHVYVFLALPCFPGTVRPGGWHTLVYLLVGQHSGGGGLDAIRAAHGRVCPQLAKSRIPFPMTTDSNDANRLVRSKIISKTYHTTGVRKGCTGC